MATAYYTPGVYIEEPDRGPRPIEGVSTSVTAFIGFTEKAEADVENKKPLRRSLLSEAKTITNWTQYSESFGGLVEGAYLPYAVRGFFDNGGTRCYIISVRTLGEPMRAQALIEAENPRTKKAVPCLYLRARQGGPNGEKISVGIKLQAASPTPSSAGQEPPQKFSLTVNGIELKATQRKTGRQRQEQVPEMDKDGKPVLDEKQMPKTTTKTVDIMEDVLEAQQKPLFTLDDVMLRHLPSAEFRDLDLTQAGALERTLDREVVSDKELLDKAKEVHKKLTEAGVEVWRLVDTSKPVALKLKATEPLKLQIYGSKFNVDTDAKLLVAPDDKKALEAAEKDGKRFDVVRAEQFRGYGRKGISALEEKDDVNLICAPDLMTLWDQDGGPDLVLTVQKLMIEHCERTQFRFAILDAPPGKDPDGIKDWRLAAGFDPQHGHGALYYPWLKIDDPLNPGRRISIPPSGHIAGIYGRSDAQRGVHKAPANETVAGVIDLDFNVTKGEQGMLNPLGINCIRQFPGRGIRVWGARTLALTDPAWRYINVRRLFNYVEASVERSMQWVVFEPNDVYLWGKVHRDISAFLRTVWRSGALFGVDPNQAFYVKCDEELNPAEIRDQGIMICEIGMAPVKPAEFVVFRFSQYALPSA